MRKLYRRLFGQPIYTVDHDGEVRKSRLKRCSGGQIFVKGIARWFVANDDGTVPKGYIKQWFFQ